MIIHITPAYKPAYIYGGPTVSVAALCEHLRSAGLEIKVFTTTANGAIDLPVSRGKPVFVEGVEVYYYCRFIKGQVHFSITLLTALYSALKNNITIVHIHSWWNATAMFSCLLGILRKRPVILSPRGMLTPYSFRNRHFIIKWVVHKILGRWLIDHCIIHVTTEKEKRDVLQIQPGLKTIVIANLIEPLPEIDQKAIKDPKPFKTPKLLYFSRIEEKKGMELLLTSLNEYKRPWSLTIAGTGNTKYIEKLKTLSRQLKIDNKIIWRGFVERTHKYELIRHHDLLVLFSKNENFANVVMESLIAGTPVAISKEVGLAGFITETNLGWVSDLTPSAIKATIEAGCYDIEKRKFIFENANQIIKMNFSNEQLIQKYINLYHLK